MSDLTIIYLTVNKMPKKWMDFQLHHLRQAVGDYPIISISREPMVLGTNLIQTEEPSYWNIYRQILRGAKLADTPYIAVAEDDTLYTTQHFSEFRPPLDAVAYDRSRWSLFVWSPIYCMRQRRGNFAMIGSRQLVIEALTEREDKFPNGHHYTGEIGREIVERRLGVTPRKAVDFYSKGPIVNLNHDTGIDNNASRRRGWVKKHGEMQAYDIPHWGKAVDIAEIYLSGRDDVERVMEEVEENATIEYYREIV